MFGYGREITRPIGNLLLILWNANHTRGPSATLCVSPRILTCLSNHLQLVSSISTIDSSSLTKNHPQNFGFVPLPCLSVSFKKNWHHQEAGSLAREISPKKKTPQFSRSKKHLLWLQPKWFRESKKGLRKCHSIAIWAPNPFSYPWLYRSHQRNGWRTNFGRDRGMCIFI